MNPLLKSMAIGLSLITGLQAMEQKPMDVKGGNLIFQEQEAKKMTPKEENAYKMWLMKQHFEKSNNQGTLPELPRDIQTVIGQTLHELSANPVLDGELVYQGTPKAFKIRDLIKKDGCMNISNPKDFGDSSDHLLITTDPKAFLRIVENSQRLVILIAPKFLIEKTIDTTTKTFQPIMGNWNEEQAPYGIFYRMERWNNLNSYDYLTSANLFTISKNNLYENWRSGMCFFTSGAVHDALGVVYAIQHTPKNFMFIFNKS